MNNPTIPDRITAALSAMEVNDDFDRKEFVKSIYSKNDYFTCRTFDVNFTKAKQRLLGKEFKCKKGFIVRIK